MSRSLTQELDALWAFIENGCDARPEDKHHALQSLDAIKALALPSETGERKNCPRCGYPEVE